MIELLHGECYDYSCRRKAFFPKSNKLSNIGIRFADVIPVHKCSLLTVNIVMWGFPWLIPATFLQERETDMLTAKESRLPEGGLQALTLTQMCWFLVTWGIDPAPSELLGGEDANVLKSSACLTVWPEVWQQNTTCPTYFPLRALQWLSVLWGPCCRWTKILKRNLAMKTSWKISKDRAKVPKDLGRVLIVWNPTFRVKNNIMSRWRNSFSSLSFL